MITKTANREQGAIHGCRQINRHGKVVATANPGQRPAQQHHTQTTGKGQSQCASDAGSVKAGSSVICAGELALNRSRVVFGRLVID